jgi:hypothetical protein
MDFYNISITFRVPTYIALAGAQSWIAVMDGVYIKYRTRKSK